MKRIIVYLSIILVFSFCKFPRTNNSTSQKPVDSVIKIEMNLSVFGVESDRLPSIKATLDFEKKYSICKVSYYNPKFKDTIYSLTQIELKNILDILQKSDLRKLKKEYSVDYTDQPTSTTTIYTNKEQFQVKDYGLKGEYPLDSIYKIVYKLY
ncbi:MAG TPA: hypothetical protein VGZ90_09020 [Puia sp.]|jgi:hypothetical protein|nr:hypothetical protein [Puia sp.]